MSDHQLNPTQAKPKHETPSPNPTQTTATSATADLVQLAQQNPQLLSANDVMQLQRTIGNQAVNQLLRPAPAAKTLQREGPPAQRRKPPPKMKPLRKMIPKSWRKS